MSSKESSVITTAGVVGVLAVTGAALLYANSRSKAPLLKEAPRHGGDLVAEALAAHNVKFVFTLIGGHISPILVGAKSRGIRIIDVRHEVTAVFAADAVSRLSDSVGVACVTAGPGLTNTITAVKNAQMAASPLVLLGGATLGILKGRGSLQDIDQQSLFRGQVKWQTTVSRVADIIPTLDKAFHIAKSGVPGPVFVELPLDTLYPADVVRTEVTKPYVGKKDWTSRATLAYINYYLRRLHAGDGDLRQSVPKRIKPLTPLSHYVQRAAEMLRKSERPVLVLGAACVQDAKLVPAVAAAARALGLPTWLSSAARGLLGPADPIQFKHKRSDALRGADLVLLLGVVCDFRLKYGAAFSSRTPLISVHPDRDALYLNRTPTLPVVASPALFLVQLADLLRGEKIPRIDWFTKLRDAEETREREIDAKAAEPTQRDMNPLALCKAIDRALVRKSVLVADGGDFIGAASYVVRPRGPLSWLDPGPFGTLGVGAGFALGAKLCRPDAEVWLLWGDGSAGYSIMEYDTFVRHSIPVIGVIGNDSCWTQIARDQVPLFDDDVGCPLSRDARYERVVAALGGAGWSVGDDGDATLGNDLTVGENDNGDGGRVSIADLDEVFARAKKIAASGRPVLVNALIGGTDFRQGSISI